MQRIIVKNFGPLKDIDLEIKDFMVLIGPNASGKSTLAKLIYAFQKLPELIDWFIFKIDFRWTSETINEEFNNSFEKQYLNFFFKTDFEITFSYSSDLIFRITPNLNQKSANLYNITSSFAEFFSLNPKIKSTFEKTESKGLIDRTDYPNTLRLPSNIFEKLNLKKERVIFIPEIKIPKSSDVATNSFESVIKDSKRILVNKPEFYIDQFLKIKSILNGTPHLSKNGEVGLLINEETAFVEFDQLSSGQKENFWFLICLSFLRKTEDFLSLIIEEPEIHLFPESQKNLIQYLIEFFNSQNLKLLITTHSHYIIGVINVLINAHRIGQNNPDKVEKVIPKDFWLDKDRVFVGRLKDGQLKSVYSEEAEIFDHEELTQTSGILNDEYGQLLEIEYDEDK